MTWTRDGSGLFVKRIRGHTIDQGWASLDRPPRDRTMRKRLLLGRNSDAARAERSRRNKRRRSEY